MEERPPAVKPPFPTGLLKNLLHEKVLPLLALPPPSKSCTTIAAGLLHTCALQTDGRLVCFGRNSDGQCTPPAELGPVAAVAAGLNHTCALRTDGGAKKKHPDHAS